MRSPPRPPSLPDKRSFPDKTQRRLLGLQRSIILQARADGHDAGDLGLDGFPTMCISPPRD